MRLRYAWAAAGLAAASAAAAAQDIPTITLRPGEAVTIRFDDGGRAAAPERSRAEWSPYALYAARELAGAAPIDQPQTQAEQLPSGGVVPEVPAPGQVRIRFFSIAGRHTLLAIDNGLDRPFVYRARMTRAGDTRPTDVCLVPPNRNAFEHWPHPIEKIELSDFRFATWQPGEPVPCQ